MSYRADPPVTCGPYTLTAIYEQEVVSRSMQHCGFCYVLKEPVAVIIAVDGAQTLHMLDKESVDMDAIRRLAETCALQG